jgi:multisubunit Na+/H+ antiporter MnhB subunit
MPEPHQLHRNSTRVMSVLIILIGIALIVRTLIAGGGALAVGLLLGVLFVAAGAGRLYLQFRQ